MRRSFRKEEKIAKRKEKREIKSQETEKGQDIDGYPAPFKRARRTYVLRGKVVCSARMLNVERRDSEMYDVS